jgi:hypothetical protein
LGFFINRIKYSNFPDCRINRDLSVHLILPLNPTSQSKPAQKSATQDSTQVEINLLEDYFALRQQWYLGSKASWNWLQCHDSDAYTAFADALKPGASISAIQSLVGTVFASYHSEGRDVLKK